MNISVKTDIQRLNAKIFELRSTVINKAIPSALNKTALQVRTQVVKSIRQRLKKMKAGAIRKRISIIKATSGNQVVVIKGRRVNIPPGAFKLPGHGNALYVHVGKKHRIIVSKSGKSMGKKISSGYQLAPVQSVQVIEEYAKSSTKQLVERVARERFPVLFERELRYYGRK